eukprot:3516773-Rhodomonas_salina.1
MPSTGLAMATAPRGGIGRLASTTYNIVPSLARLDARHPYKWARGSRWVRSRHQIRARTRVPGYRVPGYPVTVAPAVYRGLGQLAHDETVELGVNRTGS